MSAGQQGVRRLASSSTLLSRDTVCNSCLNRIAHQRRRYAAAAAAVAEEPSFNDPGIPPVTQTGPKKAYRLLASPVLSRAPLLTRELTSFEKAYYLYQKRLNERLAIPFTRYFYYKRGTPGGEEWKRKRAVRKSAARDIGMYSGYGDEAWNDEVLIGDRTAEPQSQVEALIRDAEGKDIIDAKPVGDAETDGQQISGDEREGEGMRKDLSQQQMAVERPMPRITEADEKNDLRSLNRRLDRVLYLLVQKSDGSWRFPQDRIYGKENLQQAAERTLIQSCGINMNTWMVGNHPVAHYAYDFPQTEMAKVSLNPLVPSSVGPFEQEEYGEKIFFMKGRIMAGQADLSKNEYKDKDFSWLTKEEIQERVHPGYFRSLKHMLTER